jgi:WD40 repeat protein
MRRPSLRPQLLAALLALPGCGRLTDEAPSPPPSAPSPPPPPLVVELLVRPPITIKSHLGDAGPSAAFSADRRFAAVAEAGGEGVLILDRATFAMRARVVVAKPLGPIAFSGDGLRLAVSSGPAGDITLFDTATGERVGPTLPGRGGAYSVALDSGGARLAVGGGVGDVTLWETASGQRLGGSPLLGSLINPLRFTPDDGGLIAQSYEIVALALPGLTPRYRILTERAPAVLLRGGTRLVVACEDTKICVYDAADGRFLRKLLGARPFTAAADDRAVVYVKGGAVVFQDVETGDVVRRAPAPDTLDSPQLLATSADDRRVAAFTNDPFDGLMEWDVETHARTGSYLAQAEQLGALAFADNMHVVVATAAGHMITLDLGGHPPSPMSAHGDGTAEQTALLRHGAIIARSKGHQVRIWDRGGESPRAVVDHPGATRVWLAPASDGSALLASSSAGRSLWDPDGPAPFLRGALSPWYDRVALGPRGAVGVDDGKRLLLFDAMTSRPRATPPANDVFDTLAISPDGARIAASNEDNIALYDRATGALDRWFRAPHHVGALTFSADSRLLAAAASWGSHTLSILDAEGGFGRGDLDIGEDQTVALAFSPDGQFLAAGARHGAVTIVRIEPLAVTLRYTPLRAGGQICALSPEGTAECFGAGAEDALVCRIGGRTQGMERCAEKRARGLVAR